MRGSRGSSGSSNPRRGGGACVIGASVRSVRVAAKNALLRFLGRTRLLAPTYRTYERVRAARLQHTPEPAPVDGLPVPPPHLIVRVAGTPDPAGFLESGRPAAESIGEALERAGTGIEAMTSILDFGCGCGRVVRHWARFLVGVSRSALPGAAIDWCRENLPFVLFETNGLSPPLSFARDSFDLAYAL